MMTLMDRNEKRRCVWSQNSFKEGHIFAYFQKVFNVLLVSLTHPAINTKYVNILFSFYFRLVFYFKHNVSFMISKYSNIPFRFGKLHQCTSMHQRFKLFNILNTFKELVFFSNRSIKMLSIT